MKRIIGVIVLLGLMLTITFSVNDIFKHNYGAEAKGLDRYIVVFKDDVPADVNSMAKDITGMQGFELEHVLVTP